MQTCAIDTNILLRLTAGEPENLFRKTVESLQSLLDRQPGLRIVAHNIVIGEAYIVLQKFYGLTKAEARKALAQTLQSGLVEPLDGASAIGAIDAASKGAGLIDRMILLDSEARQTLPLQTLDQKLSKLSGCELLFSEKAAAH